MSRVFSARFDIQGSISTVNPGEFDLFGEVVDLSLDGFSVSDVQIGDLVYDENTLDGTHNRYQVTQVIATGPGSIFGGGGVNACHLLVVFDDAGTFPPAGPAAGTGAICRSTPNQNLSEVPSESLKGISESLATRIRNIDNRVVIDPVLGSGSGVGTGSSLLAEYENNSGSTINALTPVRSISGGIADVDPSVESHVTRILGVVNQQINDGFSGDVTFSGLIENITTAIGVDTPVFLSKTGEITQTVPEIGIGGFISGDFVVYIGQITKNTSNPAQKDLKVDIDIRGQL